MNETTEILLPTTLLKELESYLPTYDSYEKKCEVIITDFLKNSH